MCEFDKQDKTFASDLYLIYECLPSWLEFVYQINIGCSCFIYYVQYLLYLSITFYLVLYHTSAMTPTQPQIVAAFAWAPLIPPRPEVTNTRPAISDVSR